MSIYKKLQECRVKLQGIELKKSGDNKFAKYKYFELGDFLPTVQSLFNAAGLCGVVSFDAELAKLTIFDFDSDQQIVITSPMAKAELKACHDIQNLGAVQTYQRRYLYQSALEIVEHDALDAVTGKEVDYSIAIKAAKTVEELKTAVEAIPEDQKQKYAAVKASVYRSLTATSKAE